MSFPTVYNGCDPEGAVYKVDTTQKFAIGARMVLEDGRVFRYFSAGGVCKSQLGAWKKKLSNTCAAAPTQATAAAQLAAYGETLAAGAVGSRYVTVTIDSEIGHLTTGVLTADELKGGYIVIGNGSAQAPQNRRIVSHPVCTVAGSLTLKLDGALIAAVTAGTTTIELIENPWSHLVGDETIEHYVSFLGVPAATLADGEFGWLQTWGPCWITSNSATCNSADDREIFFVANGSVESGGDLDFGDSHDDTSYQHAGFALDTSSSGSSNAPFVMLQISP